MKPKLITYEDILRHADGEFLKDMRVSLEPKRKSRAKEWLLAGLISIGAWFLLLYLLLQDMGVFPR